MTIDHPVHESRRLERPGSDAAGLDGADAGRLVTIEMTGASVVIRSGASSTRLAPIRLRGRT